MSTTVATSSPAFPRPRRATVPPGAIHWGTWALIVVLVLGPFVPLLEASLRDRPLYEAGGVFTLQPYRDLFGDSAFWTAWKNTLAFAALTTAISVGFGAAFAILCARTDLPGRRAYSRLVLLPILLPALGMVLGWIVIWGPGGYLTALFSQRLHMGTIAIDTIPGMAIVEASRLLPIAFLTCQASLTRADSSLEDAARSAGAPQLGDADLHALDRRARRPSAARHGEQHQVRLQLPLRPLDQRGGARSRLGERRSDDAPARRDDAARDAELADRHRGALRLRRRQVEPHGAAAAAR